MDREEAGAVALELMFRSDGVACERRYDSIRLSDSGTIIYFQESESESPDSESTSFNVHTYIPRIDRTIFDIAIGIPYKDQSPFETAADAYMTSVFPIVHALTSGHIDCMGVTSETVYSKDAENDLPLEYRLLLGPLRTINLESEQGDKRHFADVISDLVEPLLTEPDVYWLKCYVGKSGDSEFDSDCFINNRLHSEGKQRYLDIAKSLSGEGSFQTRKQFLAYVPLDLDESIKERNERRRARWLSAVKSQAPSLDSDTCEQVFLGIETLMALSGCPNSAMDQRLILRGCSVVDACRLPSFVASACAREIWKNHGVEWSDRYTLVNRETRTGIVGSFSNDPLYQKSAIVVTAICRAANDDDAIDAMLGYSPEHSTMKMLEEQGEALENLRFKSLNLSTDESIDGELDDATLDELGLTSETPTKPWWKFW